MLNLQRMKFVNISQIQTQNLTVKLLERTDVLIEGDANSLEFLANYILAYVNGEEHARNINPKSAGNVFFNSDSTKGLYIHILPCRHGHEKE